MSEIDENEETMNSQFQSYCANGDLENAILFHESCPQDNFNYQAYVIVSRIGHLEFIKWLHQMNPFNISMDDHLFAFTVSCKNGHYPVAKWILSLLNTNEELQRCLHHTCITENHEMTNHFFDLYPEFITDPVNQQFVRELFLTMCMINYVPFAQKIWQWIRLTDDDERYAFRSSCFFGSLDIVKWFYSVSIYTHLTPDDFVMVCRNGKFHVAQWWIDIQGDSQNTYLNYTLYRLCHDHDIDCVKQFVVIFPTIDVCALDHLVFKDAIQRKDVSIACWLAQRNPSIYTVILQDDLIVHHEISSLHCYMLLPAFAKFNETVFTGASG